MLAELDYHMDTKHDSTPERLPAKFPEDEDLARRWQHRWMVEDQKEALERWRDIKDMKAREDWADYWAARSAQKSLDKEKEKSHKRKRDQTKEQTEAATGDDKDKDPDYVQSEEGSSLDPLYEPSRKELKWADKEGDK